MLAARTYGLFRHLAGIFNHTGTGNVPSAGTPKHQQRKHTNFVPSSHHQTFFFSERTLAIKTIK
jgi:hypothetical protein